MELVFRARDFCFAQEIFEIILDYAIEYYLDFSITVTQAPFKDAALHDCANILTNFVNVRFIVNNSQFESFLHFVFGSRHDRVRSKFAVRLAHICRERFVIRRVETFHEILAKRLVFVNQDHV